MSEKTIFEQLGGTYVRQDDVFVPDIALPETEYRYGKYGRMRRQYLKEHRKSFYSRLRGTGELPKHLEEVDKACNERIEQLVNAIAKQEGVTEKLKATDMVAWVAAMNNIHPRAEEIVLQEIIYT